MILQFTTLELKACLRALQLPLSGKREQLVERLQHGIDLLLGLIEGLRHTTALTNQAQTHEDNDIATFKK